MPALLARFAPRSATALSWIMSNYWHTNYRAHQSGEGTFQYRLTSHEGGFDPVAAWRFGAESAHPAIVEPIRPNAKGALPEFPGLPDTVLDLIPVDIVVNATLAAATQANSREVRVFQVASSTENPVRLATLFDNVRAHFLQYPLRDRDGRAPNLRQWTYSSLRKFKLIFRLRYLYPLRLQERIFNRLPDAIAITE